MPSRDQINRGGLNPAELADSGIDQAPSLSTVQEQEKPLGNPGDSFAAEPSRTPEEDDRLVALRDSAKGLADGEKETWELPEDFALVIEKMKQILHGKPDSVLPDEISAEDIEKLEPIFERISEMANVRTYGALLREIPYAFIRDGLTDHVLTLARHADLDGALVVVRKGIAELPDDQGAPLIAMAEDRVARWKELGTMNAIFALPDAEFVARMDEIPERRTRDVADQVMSRLSRRENPNAVLQFYARLPERFARDQEYIEGMIHAVGAKIGIEAAKKMTDHTWLADAYLRNMDFLQNDRLGEQLQEIEEVFSGLTLPEAERERILKKVFEDAEVTARIGGGIRGLLAARSYLEQAAMHLPSSVFVQEGLRASETDINRLISDMSISSLEQAMGAYELLPGSVRFSSAIQQNMRRILRRKGEGMKQEDRSEELQKQCEAFPELAVLAAAEFRHQWKEESYRALFDHVLAQPEEARGVFGALRVEDLPRDMIPEGKVLLFEQYRKGNWNMMKGQLGSFMEEVNALPETERGDCLENLVRQDFMDRDLMEVVDRSDRLVIPQKQKQLIADRLVRIPMQAVGYLDRFPFSVEQKQDILAKVLFDHPELVVEHLTEIPQEGALQLIETFIAKKPEDIFQHLPKLEGFMDGSESLRVAKRLVDAPSQSLQRVRAQLLREIMQTDLPQEALTKIEEVFLRNNLPDGGKTFRVFEILHPAAVLEERLQAADGKLSPTLKSLGHRGRMLVIYRDFMRAQIDSDNRSLRSYLELFQTFTAVIQEADEKGVEQLDPNQLASFKDFCRKAAMLFESAQVGSHQADTRMPGASAEATDWREAHDRLRQSLGVTDGQTIMDRISAMYLRPLGFERVDQVLTRMDHAKQGADARGRLMAESAVEGKLALQSGDLLKGVDARWFASTLNTGSVAKEFLGANSDSDVTPLDTDLSLVLPEDAALDTKGALEASLAAGYGDVVFVVRNRGQFIRTDRGEKDRILSKEMNPEQPAYELFTTGVLGERHMGIRTGFPTTEIDAILLRDSFSKSTSRLMDAKMSIIQKGWYIPVINMEGEIIFTPEEFDEMRAKFYAGVKEFGGGDVQLVSLEGRSKEPHRVAVGEIMRLKQEERPLLEKATETLQNTIREITASFGVTWHTQGSESIAGAKMYDTGSSGRGTNVPESFDFDYILKLDPKDLARHPQISAELVKRFTAMGGVPHDGNRPEQLRMLGVRFPGMENGVDVDIAFVSKNEIETYESHDAVSDRLENIRETSGEEAYERVVANIVLAKQILKEGHAYKKGPQGDGGLGGIGVENWILSSGGDLMRAFDLFQQAASGLEDRPKSFEDFKKSYVVMDPGNNAKFGRHDNFIDNLTEDGYRKMVVTVREYLGKNLLSPPLV